MKSIDLAAIDLNLLVAFEAMLEQQSVTLAAEQLQIGQPAMSAALNRLRRLFEDELFVRLGRQMQPTLKAQTIAPGLLAALQQIRQAIASSQTFHPATSDRSCLRAWQFRLHQLCSRATAAGVESSNSPAAQFSPSWL